ncbi:MAG TPA: undecaprenyl-phosphate glucose phosphotransferase [Steroidobacteraceae bacterium]|jgi:putative colanic acid biosynthesis UDP-glucose lipid carrier transferase|nr:undecaprenyl-phosphate glucose phosphotransferase [Steroidobacteraceae bacterium]
MSDAVVFKKSLAIALMSVLNAILPTTCVVACLYFCETGYGEPLNTDFLVLELVVAVLSLVLLQPRGELTDRLSSGPAAMSISVALRWLILLSILFFIGYITKSSAIYARRAILTWAVLTPCLLAIISLVIFAMLRRVVMDPANQRRAIIAGANEISATLCLRLQEHSELGMSVSGFFEDRSPERVDVKCPAPILGRLPDLAAYVKAHQIDVIFVALPIRHVHRVLNLIDELRDTTASIYYVPDIFVFDLIQARTMDIVGIPVVAMCETPFAGYRGVVKRSMDIVLCLMALPILLPIMLVLGLLVAVSSPGPIIFRQRRYGLDGEQIIVYKFRTMTVLEDGSKVTQATKDDTRVTPIGRLLRRYSLDELPQLINVVQGRMSLVGPRPHAVAHNEEYRKLIKGYMVRHKVRPGITGLAQVNGCRGETSRLEDMQARVHHDLEYLRHWSALLDLQIIAKTLLQLVSNEKAY